MSKISAELSSSLVKRQPRLGYQATYRNEIAFSRQFATYHFWQPRTGSFKFDAILLQKIWSETKNFWNVIFLKVPLIGSFAETRWKKNYQIVALDGRYNFLTNCWLSRDDFRDIREKNYGLPNRIPSRRGFFRARPENPRTLKPEWAALITGVRLSTAESGSQSDGAHKCRVTTDQCLIYYSKNGHQLSTVFSHFRNVNDAFWWIDYNY